MITRLLVLGLLFFGVPAFAIPIKVAEAPFNDLALTVQTINSARSTLYMNIYEFSSPDIAAAVLGRIKAGVQVEILQEGSPVGGMSFTGRTIQAQLALAMSKFPKDRLYEMSSMKGTVKRRFRFNHAKYIIVDGKDLMIGSENYSPSGNPQPGQPGNRGWQVLIRDENLAAQFKQLFRNDADIRNGDVVELSQGPQETGIEKPAPLQNAAGLREQALRLPVYDVDAIKPIISPDNSLKGLLSIIANAKKSIDIQQMTLDSAWGDPETKSPLVIALVAAARRGVAVRVLVNDPRTFDRPGKPAKPKNSITSKILNEIAAGNKRLKLVARVANVQAMGVRYIHNKGVLIDGDLTLVSSINWNQNSVMNNRETAVLIKSEEVFNHYQALFQRDWVASAPNDERQRPRPSPSDPEDDDL